MLKSFLLFLGFHREPEIKAEYPKSFIFSDNIDLKLQYLKDLDTQENDRQSIIETKTSQLIGQTGIIFSLLSLFIPTYIDKFEDVNAIFKLCCVASFIITLSFYLLTIYHATKYLNIHRYKYGQRSATTVMKSYEKKKDFKVEEVKDLLFCIDRNTQVNNLKAGNLINAYRCFKLGNIFIGILSICLLLSFYFKNDKQQQKTMIGRAVISSRS